MKQMLLVLAMLAVAGCDPPVRRSEAESIAEDMADAHATRLAARVEELEGRIEELEQKLERLDEREDQMTEAAIEDLRSVNNRLSAFEQVYNRHTH